MTNYTVEIYWTDVGNEGWKLHTSSLTLKEARAEKRRLVNVGYDSDYIRIWQKKLVKS
jgi:hypothetical protein